MPQPALYNNSQLFVRLRRAEFMVKMIIRHCQYLLLGYSNPIIILTNGKLIQ